MYLQIYISVAWDNIQNDRESPWASNATRAGEKEELTQNLEALAWQAGKFGKHVMVLTWVQPETAGSILFSGSLGLELPWSRWSDAWIVLDHFGSPWITLGCGNHQSKGAWSVCYPAGRTKLASTQMANGCPSPNGGVIGPDKVTEGSQAFSSTPREIFAS